MKALRQLEYAKSLQLCDISIPPPESGKAIIQIVAANILSYAREIYNGDRKYPYPTPLTIGGSAVGRIFDLPSDSTSLQKNDLVIIDCTYRSRDDPSHVFLSGIIEGHSSGSKKLMSHWRDSTYAEYASVPLENCYRLNESLLLGPTSDGGHGYSIPTLLSSFMYLVPFGGFVTINLRPSETVIVAPATGPFGTAAVHLALSLGCRVIAMGRNTTTLATVQSTLSPLFPPGRLLTVPITGDSIQETEALLKAAGYFPIDAYFDISPPQAGNSSHIKASIMALRHGGRISLMGGIRGDVALPHSRIMHWNLRIEGKWMFEPKDVRDLIRMVEFGTLKMNVSAEKGEMKGFALGEWKEAFDWAAEHTGIGQGAYFKFGV